jgi:haloalkane dehalogenase
MTERSMNYVEVLGSQMAYLDEGASVVGAPVVLFLHGNPTSSYLWRNVIPHIAPQLRCVAPDLIGFGHSDKPDIAYRVADHARYLQAFIQALQLHDIVFVVHDWGSALGMDWARRHPTDVRGIALMEFIAPQPTWLDLDARPYEFLKTMRNPDIGRRLIVDENAFVEQGLPDGVVRALSDAEMQEYRRPFREPRHREPVYRFPNELPIAGHPPDVYAMAIAYHQWLLETETAKIFFHAAPGLFIPPARADFYATRLKNCRVVDLGHGDHYLPEDHPDTIGKEVAAWLTELT